MTCKRSGRAAPKRRGMLAYLRPLWRRQTPAEEIRAFTDAPEYWYPRARLPGQYTRGHGPDDVARARRRARLRRRAALRRRLVRPIGSVGCRRRGAERGRA